MLYNIDGKYYILASRKYRQVTILKDKDNGYDVKLIENAKPIEYSKNINAIQVKIEEAYNNTKTKSKFED